MSRKPRSMDNFRELRRRPDWWNGQDPGDGPGDGPGNGGQGGRFERDHYELYRRHTMDDRDIPVDLTAYVDQDNGLPDYTNVANLNTPYRFLRYNVPASSVFHVTGFCFFAVVDNTPVDSIEARIMAEQLEYYGKLRWEIFHKGRMAPIITSSYFVNPPVKPFLGVVVDYGGFAVLSKDPEGDSRPMKQGFIFTVPGPNSVETYVTCIDVIVPPASGGNERECFGVGCKLKGFLRPVT